MRETNLIEGEHEADNKNRGKLWPTDVEAFMYALDTKGVWDRKKLLELHKLLGSCRPENYVHGCTPKEWIGRFRKHNVSVYRGGVPIATFPDYQQVPKLMDRWFAEYQAQGAWEAHRVYEKIHPFADLNGRTGRLIWASMMWQESWKPSMNFPTPFLLEAYYQSLQDPMLKAKMQNYMSEPSKPE